MVMLGTLTLPVALLLVILVLVVLLVVVSRKKKNAANVAASAERVGKESVDGANIADGNHFETTTSNPVTAVEEKVIIKGTMDKTQLKWVRILVTLSAILAIIGIICFIANDFEFDFSVAIFSGGVILGVAAWVVYLWISNGEICVTDRRIYGKAIFGKRVDLPLDSVSAVGTSFFKGIAVGTSSGNIVFKGISNYIEIHSAVSNLLINRQKEKLSAEKTSRTEAPRSNADEIKKYKELLDSGVITQEEFDAKKKQLLGL